MKKVIVLPVLVFLIFFNSCKKEEDPIILDGSINLSASQEFPLGVLLEWNNIDNASDYDIYRKRKSSSESFVMIKHLHQNDIIFFDEMVDTLTSYEYYIEATSHNIEGTVVSNIASGEAIPITVNNSFSLLSELTGGASFNISSPDSLTSLTQQIIKS